MASSLFPLRIAAADDSDGNKKVTDDWISTIARNGKKAFDSSDVFGSVLKDLLSFTDSKDNKTKEPVTIKIKNLLESRLPGQVR